MGGRVLTLFTEAGVRPAAALVATLSENERHRVLLSEYRPWEGFPVPTNGYDSYEKVKPEVGVTWEGSAPAPRPVSPASGACDRAKITWKHTHAHRHAHVAVNTN